MLGAKSGSSARAARAVTTEPSLSWAMFLLLHLLPCPCTIKVALRQPKQEDQKEFKANLRYLARTCLNGKKERKKSGEGLERGLSGSEWLLFFQNTQVWFLAATSGSSQSPPRTLWPLRAPAHTCTHNPTPPQRHTQNIVKKMKSLN